MCSAAVWTSRPVRPADSSSLKARPPANGKARHPPCHGPGPQGHFLPLPHPQGQSASSARPVGTPTGLPVELGVEKAHWASPRRTSERSISVEEYNTACTRVGHALHRGVERPHPPHGLLGRHGVRPMSPTSPNTWRASGGSCRSCIQQGPHLQGLHHSAVQSQKRAPA